MPGRTNPIALKTFLDLADIIFFVDRFFLAGERRTVLTFLGIIFYLYINAIDKK